MTLRTLLRVFLVGMVCTLPNFSFAEKLGQDRGGGDTYAQEFVATAYDILQWSISHPLAHVKSEALAEIILKTKVKSTRETLRLNGETVDAINSPSSNPPLIEFNRQAWDKISEDPYRKRMLVLHEYLGLLRIDDREYQISSDIDQAQVCSRTDEIKNAIENEFNISCDRILPEDLRKIRELRIELDPLTEKLNPEDFSFLSALEKLEVDGTGLKYLPESLFDDLSSLIYLRFSNTAIERLARGQFSALASLEQLRFDEVDVVRVGYDNCGFVQPSDPPRPPANLKIVEPGAFEGLTSLKLLSLAHNKIESLSFGAFSGLPQLKVLLLRDNRISTIESGAFDSLGSLEYLDLSFNRLQVLNPHTFKGVQPEAEVRLHANGFELIKSNAFADLKGIVGVSPLYYTFKAENYWQNGFQGRKIELEAYAFRGPSRVATYICGTGPDSGFQGPASFDLIIGNQFDSIEANIHPLAFSGNLEIDNLSLPGRLPDSVLRVDQLKGFQHLSGLEVGSSNSYKGQHNLISHIEPGTFKQIPGLKRLLLFAEFSSLDLSIFEEVRNLSYLHLNGRDLDKLPDNFFTQFQDIQTAIVKPVDRYGALNETHLEWFKGQGFNCWSIQYGGFQCYRASI